MVRHSDFQRLSVVVAAAAWSCVGSLHAAGTLTPVGSAQQRIQIREHQVNVVINNGFARTEVVQTFFNPNAADLEAIYRFPVPKSGSLAEVVATLGEKEIHGEVLSKREADALYEEEKSKGNDAGLAKKNSYETFEFRVSPVRAGAETKLRFVYYQPLEIDTSVGRYVYPLEDGGTDGGAAAAFWTGNDAVEGTFSVDVVLKTALPIAALRVPGFESETTIETVDQPRVRLDDFLHVLEAPADKLIDPPGVATYKVHVERRQTNLNRDFVLYYRLPDSLPGRVELIAYRADASQPGTFMLIVTPGIDLEPLTGGADYVFVLDVSGSMAQKIQMLASGVGQALGKMSPQDRFRVVTFSDHATEVAGWTAATPQNVAGAVAHLNQLGVQGGTNLYAGVAEGLKKLDAERATSLILVTDGVANVGIVDPSSFRQLLEQYDLRVFGFLMGNSANWPLMRLIAESSGGFYTSVSNADDVLGQVTLARSKVTSECLHDVDLKISGVKVRDANDGFLGKVYRGQQLVIFGRYERGGMANLELLARMTGEDHVYRTSFEFPERDTDHPELERLWALSRVETIEMQKLTGGMPPAEAEKAIEALGVEYQLVTDETSMVLLTDEAFAARGIDRRNHRRTAVERDAQVYRDGQPVRSQRVDEPQPMFNRPAASPRSGAGAIDPLSAAMILCIGGLAATRRR